MHNKSKKNRRSFSFGRIIWLIILLIIRIFFLKCGSLSIRFFPSLTCTYTMSEREKEGEIAVDRDESDRGRPNANYLIPRIGRRLGTCTLFGCSTYAGAISRWLSCSRRGVISEPDRRRSVLLCARGNAPISGKDVFPSLSLPLSFFPLSSLYIGYTLLMRGKVG